MKNIKRKFKIFKSKTKIKTTIKRSELLLKLRCLGGKSWKYHNVDSALEKVNTIISSLLSYQNPYSFYPDPDYELKLTKQQIDLMFNFYTNISQEKFNDAYHELWDSIEKLWETCEEDDYLAYDELVAIYGLLFAFKQAVELANLKTSYQNIKEELEQTNKNLESVQYEYARIQCHIARTALEHHYHLSKIFKLEVKETYEEEIKYRILNGELKIDELSFAERTDNKSYYILSFRYCRDCENEEEYNQTLELLKSDINLLPNYCDLRETLEKLYDSYSDYEYCLKCKTM